MRVGLQRVGITALINLALLLCRNIIPLNCSIVQVSNEVVGLLAGPHGEPDSVGCSSLKRTHLAEVPGNAVLVAEGSAGRGCPLGEVFLALCLLVVLIAADRTACNLGAYRGKLRETVVYRDVVSTDVLESGFRNCLEFAFDGVSICGNRLLATLALACNHTDQTVIGFSGRR